MATDVEFTWITPHLAVGGRVPVEHVSKLRAHGIARVIDMRHDTSDGERDDEEVFRSWGLKLLHLPTLDLQAVSQEMLWRGVDWVLEALREREKVLIHCQHGIGRSALLACCTLVAAHGMSPDQALQLAKTSRAKVSPSPEQLHAFLEWAGDWHQKIGQPAPGVTWDRLAEIAYSHASLR